MVSRERHYHSFEIQMLLGALRTHLDHETLDTLESQPQVVSFLKQTLREWDQLQPLPEDVYDPEVLDLFNKYRAFKDFLDLDDHYYDSFHNELRRSGDRFSVIIEQKLRPLLGNITLIGSDDGFSFYLQREAEESLSFKGVPIHVSRIDIYRDQLRLIDDDSGDVYLWQPGDSYEPVWEEVYPPIMSVSAGAPRPAREFSKEEKFPAQYHYLKAPRVFPESVRDLLPLAVIWNDSWGRYYLTSDGHTETIILPSGVEVNGPYEVKLVREGPPNDSDLLSIKLGDSDQEETYPLEMLPPEWQEVYRYLEELNREKLPALSKELQTFEEEKEGPESPR